MFASTLSARVHAGSAFAILDGSSARSRSQRLHGAVVRSRGTSRNGAVSVRAAVDDPSASSSRGVILEEPKCELLSNEGGKYSLVGEMVVDSDADSMYRMLTDYAASPRIFSTVDSVQTADLDDGRLLVSQQCRWKFMVFGGAFPCHLAVKEQPARRHMEVALHKKGFIREFEGSWTVTNEPGGGVRVRHTLALRPALTPPYAHKIFLRQIGEILTDVKAEVERWDGAAYYPAPIDDMSSDSIDFGSGDEGMTPVPQSR